MPFNMFKSKELTDFKARLERKMCIARDTPEPIFDLSECNLKSVPSGVFSLCRVLRKEALFLQENALTTLDEGNAWKDLSLLKVLDVHNNLLARLPDGIGALNNLEVLIVSNNRLTRLPDSLGLLVNLRSLKAANNKLKDIPASIVNCRRLTSLDLRGNPLKKLPTSLSQLVHLESVNVDFSAPSFVPVAIEAIEDNDGCGIKSTRKINGSSVAGAVESEFFLLQEKLRLLEQQKESQKQERLAWEKTLLESNELAATMNCDRSQLVRDILSMESHMDKELMRLQGQKDAERNVLVDQCLIEDAVMNEAVHRLLESTKRSQEQLTRMTELDDQMFQKHFQDETKRLDESAIINAMNELALEEIMKAEKLRDYEARKKQTVRHWINDESAMASSLADLACKHKNESEMLTTAIAQDERLQKAAVAAMLESSDAKSWLLAQQVASIEQKLSELTKVELNRRKATQEDYLTELAVSRVSLTELLMDVLAQQQTRREELVATLQRLDHSRGGDEEGYWLQQYSLLMQSTSHHMVKAMQAIDSRLLQELSSYEVLHYLPLLTTHMMASHEDIAAIDDGTLLSSGIESADDRALLLKAINAYLSALTPSAPCEAAASAPPMPVSHVATIVENECCVCLSAKAEAVFLPCGHMCCCSECSSLEQCPLCRTAIQTVVHAIIQ